MKVDTFTNETRNFLIKIFTGNKCYKVYFFSEYVNSKNEYELKIYPSGKTFKIFENSIPLVIQPKENIENIFVIAADYPLEKNRINI